MNHDKASHLATPSLDRRDFLASAALAASATLLSGCGTTRPDRRQTPIAAAPAAAFARFGVTEASVRKVMSRAMRGGGEYCDLFFQRKTTHHLSLEDHAVNKATSTSEMGLGVRVVRGLETGYAYTESLDLTSMLAAADVAATVARGPARALPSSFRVGKLPSRYPAKVPWSTVDTATKVKLLVGMHDRTVKRDARVKKVNIRYRDEHSDILVIDSLGRVASDSQPMAVCYVSCMAEHGGKRESNYSARSGRAGLEFFDELEPAVLQF